MPLVTVCLLCTAGPPTLLSNITVSRGSREQYLRAISNKHQVIETFGTYNPSTGGTHKGKVTANNGVYDVYVNVRTNAPSISGTQTFNQYLSVRQTKRTKGKINLAKHFAAWKGFGMVNLLYFTRQDTHTDNRSQDLGTFNYQIMATEGYQSSGSSSIVLSTVS